MLEAYHKLHPQPKSITELKEALHVIWDSLPQGVGTDQQGSSHDRQEAQLMLTTGSTRL